MSLNIFQDVSLTVMPLRYSRSWEFMRRFRKDQDGSLIIMSLLLLITMLLMGGMAVDFMRFETERVKLQSIADRAVLAAAELEEDLDPSLIVTDFFEKAGYGEAIVGSPDITRTINTRQVGVTAEVNLDTIYLRFAGIDQLSAPATASAKEGVGKVEISLVIDVSASMRSGGSTGKVDEAGTRYGRIGDLQAAAKAFAETVLDEKYGGRVSLNIVPYGGHVNPGPEMAAYLGSTTAAHYEDVAFTLDENFTIDGETRTVGEMISAGAAVTDHRTAVSNHRINDDDLEDNEVYYVASSHCVEIADSDWAHAGLPSRGQDLLPTFMIYNYDDWELEQDVRGWGWCPHDESAIKYAIQDYEDVEDYIDDIILYDGTGTDMAMKWGLALLDPTTQPAFAHLNNINNDLVPDDFASRPAAWDDDATEKVIVLMTDGGITSQWRPGDNNDENNLLAKEPRSERVRRDFGSTAFNRFNATCELAKAPGRNITIYTVAFETTGRQADAMTECTSDEAQTHFETSGAGLVAVFQDIAEQITELRLTN